MKKTFSCKWMYIGMLLIYISVSDIFGFVDLNVWIGSGGELYDLVFLAVLAGSIFFALPYIHIPLFKEERRIGTAVCVLFGYIIVSGIVLVLSGRQSIFQTLSVMREVFYILIFYAFWRGKYETDKMLKLIIGLELAAEFFYFIECFTGPLTPLHIQAHMETVGIWRMYGAAPLYANFMCPLLVYRYYKKEYLFSRKKDMLILSLLIGFLVIKLGRTALFLTLLVVLFAVLDASKRSSKKLKNALVFIILAVIMSVLICSILFPAYLDRLWEAVISLTKIGDHNYNSTLLVRTSTIRVRYDYLMERGKQLWGLGPLHNDTKITLAASIHDHANEGVIASDTAYGSLLIRYGMVGIILYILPYIVCIINYVRKSDPFCKSIALYAFTCLVGGMTGHAALCFYAPLKLGILLGIVSKERRDSPKYINLQICTHESFKG